MPETPASRALVAAGLALAVAVACIACFLPPLVTATTSSLPRIVGVGAVLAAAVLTHWAFLAIAAQRTGRSVGGWVALSVLMFPVGSAASLILLSWLRDEDMHAAALPSHG